MSARFLHFHVFLGRCSLLLRPLLEDYTSRLRSCSRDTETAFLRRVWCGGLPVTGLHTGRRKQKLRETPRIPLCSVPACPKILTPHSCYRGAGSEGEQLGLKPVPIEDAIIAGSSLTHCTVAPAPGTVFGSTWCSLLLRPLLEDYTSRLRSCSRDTETAFLRRVWCGGLPVTGLHTGRRKQKLRETPRIPLCSVPACPKILTPHSAVFCFGRFRKTTPQDCVHVPETQKRPSCGEFGVVAFLSLDCTQGGESRSLEKPQESLFALFQPAPRF
nr:uncharacterized protein LOC127488699 isoform X4 [Oryctolagus cuniculus]